MDVIFQLLLNNSDYYNHKGWYSMILQGVVDGQYCFLDVYTGWPGSIHDARVFAHSPLSKQVTDGKLLPNNSIMVSGDGQAVFTMHESLLTHRSLNQLQMVNYCQTTLLWSVELKYPFILLEMQHIHYKLG